MISWSVAANRICDRATLPYSCYIIGSVSVQGDATVKISFLAKILYAGEERLFPLVLQFWKIYKKIFLDVYDSGTV